MKFLIMKLEAKPECSDYKLKKEDIWAEQHVVAKLFSNTKPSLQQQRSSVTNWKQQSLRKQIDASILEEITEFKTKP